MTAIEALSILERIGNACNGISEEKGAAIRMVLI